MASGDIWMSDRVSWLTVGKREGKIGRFPSSWMKTDSKYLFSKLALSMSADIRIPSELISGATPDEEESFLFTNL